MNLTDLRWMLCEPSLSQDEHMKKNEIRGRRFTCLRLLEKCGFSKITNLVSAHVIHNLPFRFPSNLTSKSFQFYSDLTSVPHRFLAGVTSVCFRLHFHLTSISFAIFNSREGCIPCLQIQMDDPRTAPETLQTNWVATENSHSSEKKTCLSQRHFTSPENHTTWRLSDSSGSQKYDWNINQNIYAPSLWHVPSLK